MRELTPAEIADHARHESLDPLAVHTTTDGDVETIELASDFAALGPAEIVKPSTRRGFWRACLDAVTGGWH